MANGFIEQPESNYQKEYCARPSLNKASLQLFPDLAKPFIAQHKVTDPKIEWIINELSVLSKTDVPYGTLYAQSLSYILAIQLAKDNGRRKSPTKQTGGLSGRNLRDVADYIDANLNEKLSVSTLARRVGLSPHHFSHSFSASFGLSPHRYVLQRRIAEATRLLKESKLSVAEIAYELGFSSHAHFSQIYRKNTGMSPKDVRNG